MVLTSLWEDNRLNIFISPVSDTFLALASKKGFSPFQGYCVTGIQQIWWGFDESCSQSSLQVPSKIGFFVKVIITLIRSPLSNSGNNSWLKLEQKFPFPPGLRRGTLNVKVAQCQTYSEHLIVATLSILCLCPIVSNAGALVFIS